MDPRPFLRGAGFAGTPRVPYPRAKAEDAGRLPLDTWMQAQIPVGIRLEFTGDAAEIVIRYETKTDQLGFRGEGAGTTFQLWRKGVLVSEEQAKLGEGRAMLKTGDFQPEERAIVYLPEGMKPLIHDVAPSPGGTMLEAAAPQPRWVAYGDSIGEGWSASAPALGWCSIAAREHGLDLINMGYAGAARGELVSAEHIAEIGADVISITHGTNCWNRIPHSKDQMRANTAAFIDMVRQGHPNTPILVCTPVVRPEAEDTPNKLGATLQDLRREMERAVTDRDVSLVDGLPIIDATMLADATHPNDDGHRAIAATLGPLIAKLVR
jgi:lysophospholipase L1-like esterase